MDSIHRRVWSIPDGDAGIVATLDHMQRLVHDERSVVRHQALGIVSDVRHGAPWGSYALAAALYDWVGQHLIYTPDSAPIEDALPLQERLRSPALLLHLITNCGSAPADCDDWVMLLTALWDAAGYRVQWIVVALDDSTDFSHVYAAVDTSLGWVAGDGIHGRPFGWELDPSRIRRRLTRLPFSAP